MSVLKLFDAHCHLQDQRVFNMSTQIIRKALDNGVAHFALNGICESDWHLVKVMSDRHPSVILNFGIHPWFVADRTPNWLDTLKEFFETNPAASVGEIGLDKGSRGKQIDFTDQVEVFRQQLQLAKKLKRPAFIHCVRAFGDLLDILKSEGPFPAGVLWHSFLGSAELVPEFAKLGDCFSFSRFLMSMKESKAKKMLMSVPRARILSETDAPDVLPKSNNSDSLLVIESPDQDSTSKDSNLSEDLSQKEIKRSTLETEYLNHVLSYAASSLDMTREELAEISYRNALANRKTGGGPCKDSKNPIWALFCGSNYFAYE